MADHSAKQATAARMIREKGLPMLLVRRERDEDALPVPGGGYEWQETATDTYAVKTQASAAEVQKGVFNGTDMVLLVAGLEHTPKTTDTLVMQGLEYDILAVRIITPAEADILYKIQVKEADTADG